MEVSEDIPAVSGQSQAQAALDPGTWRCMACTKASNCMQILPCQHKFCETCLRLWSMIYIDMYNGVDDEFPCQVCWKRYAVPVQGLQAYEQDYQVRVLQETMNLMSMGPTEEVAPLPNQNVQRVEDSDYMQQPLDNANANANANASATSMDADTQPISSMPSMVSHMVPQQMTGTMDPMLGPGYCYRSRHLYMAHMV